jgi:hypothetical protein
MGGRPEGDLFALNEWAGWAANDSEPAALNMLWHERSVHDHRF